MLRAGRGGRIRRPRERSSGLKTRSPLRSAPRCDAEPDLPRGKGQACPACRASRSLPPCFPYWPAWPAASRAYSSLTSEALHALLALHSALEQPRRTRGGRTRPKRTADSIGLISSAPSPPRRSHSYSRRLPTLAHRGCEGPDGRRRRVAHSLALASRGGERAASGLTGRAICPLAAHKGRVAWRQPRDA